METVLNININNNDYDDELLLEIESKCKTESPLDETEMAILLDHLCYKVRKAIAEYCNQDINNYLFAFKCDLAQSMIYYYLHDLNIDVNPVNINEILTGCCGHSFIIATFNTPEGPKQYLIDPTYLQFFAKEDCDEKKFIIINNIICTSPAPGYFILKNHSEKIIMPLLNQGYIDFSKEVAKAYGDSFFQTKTGIEPDTLQGYVTTGENYIRWFNSKTARLTMTQESLRSIGLLIEPINNLNIKK